MKAVKQWVHFLRLACWGFRQAQREGLAYGDAGAVCRIAILVGTDPERWHVALRQIDEHLQAGEATAQITATTLAHSVVS